MICEIQGQITMFQPINNCQITAFQPINNGPSTPLNEDIVYKNGEIYTNPNDYMFSDIPSWMPKDAWGKRLKDGTYVFHSFKANDRPKHPRKDHSATLQDYKRRFLYKLMMDSGNPTWKDVEDFINWLYAYKKAKTVEAVKEIICDKYCFICKNRKRNSCSNDDIGEDALLLSVNGFKNDRRKAN